MFRAPDPPGVSVYAGANLPNPPGHNHENILWGLTENTSFEPWGGMRQEYAEDFLTSLLQQMDKIMHTNMNLLNSFT
jgi:hypothetical protein